MTASRGQMDKRITLEENVPTEDEGGGQVEDWQPIGTFWARVRPLRGRELVYGTERTAEFNHEVTMDYQASILTIPRDSLRINWAGKILNVISATNIDEKNYQIQMLAREGVPT